VASKKNIFISYRRSDDPGFVRAIYQRLQQEFPSYSVFMDVEDIEPGADFVSVVNEKLQHCDVVLAIIGRGWIDSKDEHGNRRLENEGDHVRTEIAAALDANKRVIPVLVNDAHVPSADDLPPSLKPLAQRNAAEIRHRHFDADIQELIHRLKNPSKVVIRYRLPFLAWILVFGLAAVVFLLLALGLHDAVGENVFTITFVLGLSVALVVALGFGFVNGFHDTANAVTTVIYTRSLPERVAVPWSGVCNSLGALLFASSVAFVIMSLLPVQLLLGAGSADRFPMVFALLIAAVFWNLGTWYLGLPASSSHTLIGSILGVGIAYEFIHGRDLTIACLDWSLVWETGWALLLSPVVGFAAAALLLLRVRSIVSNPALYRDPKGKTPPPWWIRIILILTCTGVSLAHGSQDGQKCMGLVMLILIATLPTAYALNHRPLPHDLIVSFQAASPDAAAVITRHATGYKKPDDPATSVLNFVCRRSNVNIDQAAYAALSDLMTEVSEQVGKSVTTATTRAPAAAIHKEKWYLVSQAIRVLVNDWQSNGLGPADVKALTRYKTSLDDATQASIIPWWVKWTVAIALGLGTIVGYQRIVVTVGERIGKSHLTYAQGGSAELVAAATILAATLVSLPVSTTHVLSSGIAGTMAANNSGLQWVTIRNILWGWVLTLPVAIALSATLYWAFSRFF
jgi:PiT family inorganic phosphate transporter